MHSHMPMAHTIGIFIVGPSSTGKSTLCRALEKYLVQEGLRVAHISEVARTVMKQRGFTRDDVGTLAMQKAILDAQIEAETKALESLERSICNSEASNAPQPSILICDRCAIDPSVYAEMELTADDIEILTGDLSYRLAVSRYGGNPARTHESIDDIRRSSLIHSVVILTDGVEEWREDDGVRSLYDPWKVADVFRRKLAALRIPYHEVGEDMKDLGERINWVVQLAGLE
ncbi:hypothetical protein FRC14_008036 [Serendipita sp. 396]|nr:hypothetical protein FRC14_008036 [Serendipita sp. 396]KAG8777719.1 hypothetical protein FRC15_011157 [Serendipita sp. 397]KAG8793718.1 hypothetical protein FRC16_010856 [Serendipita sp. 398]KAG8859879.1 hypothetical protein FRC20_011753 [Serendipita sp. 405]